MSPGATYALITFISGGLLLLGWLYATTDNPRSGVILKKSVFWFALPIIFWPAGLINFPLSLWFFVACEEGLKTFASTREDGPADKFWLVALFGIWELTLSKPIWGWTIEGTGGGPDRLALMGLLYATALPVLMHAVTAAIYAITSEKRLWAAFVGSWIIHMSFNEAAAYSYGSPMAVIAETIVLVVILALLLKRVRTMDGQDDRSAVLDSEAA